MDENRYRRRNSGESVQWRTDFKEAFRTAFIAIATMAPGDWQWRMESTTHLFIVIRSEKAGCIYSRTMSGELLGHPAHTAALLMADELRRWIEDRRLGA